MSERICGIPLPGYYQRGQDLYRVVTVCEQPSMVVECVHGPLRGERLGGAIGAPIFDGLVELVPVTSKGSE